MIKTILIVLTLYIAAWQHDKPIDSNLVLQQTVNVLMNHINTTVAIQWVSVSASLLVAESAANAFSVFARFLVEPSHSRQAAAHHAAETRELRHFVRH